MARIALTRTIRSLPGKRQQYMEFLSHANAVRRQFGLVQTLILQKAVDPHELLEIQVWESAERYQEWQNSGERADILAKGRRLRVREPTVMYQVLEEE